MASKDLLIWLSNKAQRFPSGTNSLSFLSVMIGSDQLEIKETLGNFDFSAFKLTNIANGVATTDAAAIGQVMLLTGSQAMTGNLNMGSNNITNLADPTTAQQAATKNYVDNLANGISWKNPVAAISTTPLAANTYANGASGVGATLTANANGAIAAIDGYTPLLNDRLLIDGEAAASHNGIYTVTQVGSGSLPYILTRSLDNDTSVEMNAAAVFVENGTANADTAWVQTAVNPTIGTTGIAFSKFSSVSGYTFNNGLTLTGNTVNVTPGDSSLVATPGSLEVQEDPAGAIITGGSGIKINLESSNPTLKISSNQLGVKLNPAGAIVTSSTGLTSQVDGSTITINGSNQLNVPASGITSTQLATSVAGSGLTGGGGSPLSVVTGDGIYINSNAVSVDYTATVTNDNAGSITVGQVAYVKSNGHVDLAIATISTLDQNELVVVSDASIATTASGKAYARNGAVIGGYASLTPGKVCYVSNSVAGAITQDLSSWSAGQQIYAVGRAISATQIVFDPQFIIQY